MKKEATATFAPGEDHEFTLNTGETVMHSGDSSFVRDGEMTNAQFSECVRSLFLDCIEADVVKGEFHAQPYEDDHEVQHWEIDDSFRPLVFVLDGDLARKNVDRTALHVPPPEEGYEPEFGPEEASYGLRHVVVDRLRISREIVTHTASGQKFTAIVARCEPEIDPDAPIANDMLVAMRDFLGAAYSAASNFRVTLSAKESQAMATTMVGAIRRGEIPGVSTTE